MIAKAFVWDVFVPINTGHRGIYRSASTLKSVSGVEKKAVEEGSLREG